MLYFKTTTGTIGGNLVSVLADAQDDTLTVCRWNFRTFADAEMMAAKANALNDGETYIATDAGPNVSPRYDVKTLPKVGQEVSYAFNGDYYPCGKIVSVGKGPKATVKTSTGEVFYRRKLTGGWLKKGGTWWLVMGTHAKLNPSF
jgi:hypothetical protein